MEAHGMDRWWKLLAAYFGVKLTKDEIDGWEGELEREIRHLMPGEIASAIRWKSRQSDTEPGRFRSKPTLKDIRIWVFQWRREARDASGGAEAEACDRCYEGWLSFRATYDDYPNGPLSEVDVFPDRPGQHNTSLPCLCKAGEEHMNRIRTRCKDEGLDGLLSLRRTVGKRWKRAEAALAAANAQWDTSVATPAEAPF